MLSGVYPPFSQYERESEDDDDDDVADSVLHRPPSSIPTENHQAPLPLIAVHLHARPHRVDRVGMPPTSSSQVRRLRRV